MAWRAGKPQGTISWTNGDLFNGFALVQFCDPTLAGVAWPSVSMGHQFPVQALPWSLPVGIVDGVFDSTVAVPYNADATPPSTQYEAYYYENNGVLIGGPTTAFTVSAETFVMPTVTLTAPSAGVVVPPIPMDPTIPSATFTKDPGATLDFSIDWTTWLSGDTITISAWSVPSGITSVSETITSSRITTIWLSGGSVGGYYSLVNTITTAGSRVNEMTITIAVQDQ